MNTVVALDAGSVTKLGVGIIVGLIVLGVIISMIVTAIIVRVVVIALVVAAGIFVWQQRTSIENNVNTRVCDLNTTFFGVHVDPSTQVEKVCARKN